MGNDQGHLTEAKNVADAADDHVSYTRSQTNDAGEIAHAMAMAAQARARYTALQGSARVGQAVAGQKPTAGGAE